VRAERVMRGLVLAAAIATGGCVPIDGGAVELRWTIRDESGCSRDNNDSCVNDCGQARITRVTLVAELDSGEVRRLDFACDAGYGSSDFALPAGRHLFYIEPGGPGATDAVVPDPISAQVHQGEVTDLQVLVIRIP
jgi:hypothetical protein